MVNRRPRFHRSRPRADERAGSASPFLCTPSACRRTSWRGPPSPSPAGGAGVLLGVNLLYLAALATLYRGPGPLASTDAGQVNPISGDLASRRQVEPVPERARAHAVRDSARRHRQEQPRLALRCARGTVTGCSRRSPRRPSTRRLGHDRPLEQVCLPYGIESGYSVGRIAAGRRFSAPPHHHADRSVVLENCRLTSSAHSAGSAQCGVGSWWPASPVAHVLEDAAGRMITIGRPSISASSDLF